MFSLRPVFKASLAFLVFLVLPSASVVVAQQQEDDVENATTTTLLTSNDNTTDSLLMTNYNAMREEGQGFWVRETTVLHEKPGTNTTGGYGLFWWCDLEFSSDDATNNYGYVGRGVGYVLGQALEHQLQNTPSLKRAHSISAAMVPTLGIFEGQFHATHDDWVNQFWDDGNATLPRLGWEGHDEGDMSPNADASAFSASGLMTKITTEAAAELLGMDVVDMTPATCSTEYDAAWNATHVPDPIDTSVTDLEETVAQLQADNKELLSRIVAIEGSLPANDSGSSGDDGTSSSPFMAWYKHDTTDIVGVKASMIVAIIMGLVAVDYI